MSPEQWFLLKGEEMLDTVVNLIGDNFTVAIFLTLAFASIGLGFLPALFRTVLPGDPVSRMEEKFSNSYVRQPDEELIEKAKQQREEKLAA